MSVLVQQEAGPGGRPGLVCVCVSAVAFVLGSPPASGHVYSGACLPLPDIADGASLASLPAEVAARRMPRVQGLACAC